jgi:hypothetical protein
MSDPLRMALKGPEGERHGRRAYRGADPLADKVDVDGLVGKAKGPLGGGN